MSLKNSALRSDTGPVAMATCGWFSQLVVQPDFPWTKDSLDAFALGRVKTRTAQQLQNIDFLPRNYWLGGKIVMILGHTYKGISEIMGSYAKQSNDGHTVVTDQCLSPPVSLPHFRISTRVWWWWLFFGWLSGSHRRVSPHRTQHLLHVGTGAEDGLGRSRMIEN